mgnify:CR=1 FL=1
MDAPNIPHFMPGGSGGISKMTQEEEDQQNFKVSDTIDKMDDELKDRFKALKAIQDLCRDFDEEENEEIRKLEILYENKYKEIYKQREELVNGKNAPDAGMIEAFNLRATEMKDADFDKISITPCDVKAIQNSPSGVSDFWIKAMLNHPIGQSITEKDRPILGYLTNIELDLHSGDLGKGYDIIFTFDANSYFEGTIIKKSLFMKDQGMLDKTTTPAIQWKENCNPTVKKQKKKKGGKKISVEVSTDSFFNMFKDIDPESEEEKKKKEEAEKKLEEEGDKEEFQDMDDEGIENRLADDLD